jgi:hypothetical protein
VSTPASVTRGVSGWRLGRVLLNPTWPAERFELVAVIRRLPSPSQVSPARRRPSTAARVPLALLGDRRRRAGKGATARAAAFPAARAQAPRSNWVIELQAEAARRHRSNRNAQAVNVSNARTPVDVQKQTGHVAPLGRMRPKRARRATRLLPVHETPSANGPLFVRSCSHCCAGLLAARGAFPHPFAVFLPSGGGGNRTRVREPPRKSFYKRRPSWLSPAGR